MEQKKNETDEVFGNKVVKGGSPIKRGEIVLREDSFDGIQEYDQRMPNWWLILWWSAIVFFFVYYIVYYTMGAVPTTTETMDARVEAIHQLRKDALQKTLDSMDDDVLVNKLSMDAEFVAAGKDVYMSSCVACHGADMKSNGGATARPLDDGIWHYGDKPMDIFTLILKGTPAESKGYNMMRMPPWESLGPDKVAQVTAYLISQNQKDFEKYKK
ncbi:MAG: cbb3-type cytochrome c oxidase N-terminal domain-containing protein [Akkermansiaceae bacterium]